jgi:hypothetical protein
VTAPSGWRDPWDDPDKLPALHEQVTGFDAQAAASAAPGRTTPALAPCLAAIQAGRSRSAIAAQAMRSSGASDGCLSEVSAAYVTEAKNQSGAIVLLFTFEPENKGQAFTRVGCRTVQRKARHHVARSMPAPPDKISMSVIIRPGHLAPTNPSVLF